MVAPSARPVIAPFAGELFGRGDRADRADSAGQQGENHRAGECCRSCAPLAISENIVMGSAALAEAQADKHRLRPTLIRPARRRAA